MIWLHAMLGLLTTHTKSVFLLVLHWPIARIIISWYHVMISYHDMISWYDIMISYHDMTSWYDIMIWYHAMISWYNIIILWMISYHDIISWYDIMKWPYHIMIWCHIMISYHDIISWYHVMWPRQSRGHNPWFLYRSYTTFRDFYILKNDIFLKKHIFAKIV